MPDSPLVSIVIPVYNGANYLRQAIDSALAQTYQPCEVLVINDGSRDEGQTERIAQSYGQRIRYLAKPNGGVATALNLGVQEMRGTYFSWLSHDDVYYPHKVASQVPVLQQQGPDAICYSDYDIIDASGTVVRAFDNRPFPPAMFRPMLIRGMGLQGCSLLIPRVLFDRFGLFKPELRCTQDYDLWFRMAKSVRMIHLPQRLMQSREHAEAGSFKLDTRREEYWLFRRAIDDLTEAELAFAGDPASTLLDLAAELARYPKRCSAGIHAYQRYRQTPGHRLGHLRKRMEFFVRCLYQRWHGQVLSAQQIGEPV